MTRCKNSHTFDRRSRKAGGVVAFAAVVGLTSALLGSTSAFAALPANALLVGPGHPYATPCAAIAAAPTGATVEIDAKGNGTYDGDVCSWSTNGLKIVGINGRPHIDAAGHNSQGKATWVISGNDTVVQNVELSGATVPDGNGAAIRQEGTNLTVIRSYFHDNQNGILAGANPASNILIDSSEFAFNGAGDGYTHNMYIGHVHNFTLRYSWSHDAKVGHLVKSRAATTNILYNRLTGQNGTESYELDLPNGGAAYVIGNVIEHGPGTQNPNMVAYGEEGSLNPNSQLVMVNNTIVNTLGRGAAVYTGSTVTTPVLFQNNISTGSPTLVTQSAAILTSNCVTDTPGFVNAATYDYRLTPGSPCVNIGTPAGTLNGVNLTPRKEYVQPTSHRTRPINGKLDAGAFEQRP